MTLIHRHRPNGSRGTDEESHPFEEAAVLMLRAATLVLVAYLAASW
jgi:hypothetical protein